MITVHGPGRCTECSFHVATQGHRKPCSGTSLVTPVPDDGYTHRREDLPLETWAFAEWVGLIPRQKRASWVTPALADRAVGGGNPAYVTKAIRSELDRLAAAREGVRNSTLHAVACNVFEFVKGGHADRQACWDELKRIGLAIGLGEYEIEGSDGSRGTLGSAWNKVGPRGVPALRGAAV